MPFLARTLATGIAVVFAFGCGSDGPTNPGSGGNNPPPGGNNPPPANATVNATVSSTFNPAQVTIAQNGTVTWAFAGLTHNVTFSAANSPANIPDQSNTSVSRTFANLGTFAYTCTLHPGMNGSVTVAAP
jgi:plastocyanin